MIGELECCCSGSRLEGACQRSCKERTPQNASLGLYIQHATCPVGDCACALPSHPRDASSASSAG